MSNIAGPSNSGPSQHYTSSSKPSNRSRYQVNLKKYGTPLPILLPSSPLHPSYKPPSKQAQSYLSTFLSVFEAASKIEMPSCTGLYDAVTRSVWVTDRQDMEILFNRGFFGKGTLSRSEPTWHARRLDQVRGGDSAAAEKIREKRRLERKQFKIDRAEAMLSAAKTAEAVLMTGQLPSEPADPSEGRDLEESTAAGDGDVDGDEEVAELDGQTSPTLTAATSNFDFNTLTPQTFLVRPTRPDANRNRGKKAFRRKPPAPKPETGTAKEGDASISARQAVGNQAAPPPLGAANTQAVVIAQPPAPASGDAEDEEHLDEDSASEEDFDDTVVEDMEHLQLGLEEAWFLSTALGVLKIYDAVSDTFLPTASLLAVFLTPLDPSPRTALSDPSHKLWPDDPFLVSYAGYHHFRTLGWVVKPGIKFSCDWLLYRRGPVFSHAAFSIVVIPVYASAADRERSIYAGEDWYAERMSWKWMNTVMRVNSLVQKNVILVYITIPSLDSISSEAKLDAGSLDPEKNSMKDLMQRYTIKEVSLSRFSPARRRG